MLLGTPPQTELLLCTNINPYIAGFRVCQLKSSLCSKPLNDLPSQLRYSLKHIAAFTVFFMVWPMTTSPTYSLATLPPCHPYSSYMGCFLFSKYVKCILTSWLLNFLLCSPHPTPMLPQPDPICFTTNHLEVNSLSNLSMSTPDTSFQRVQ